MISTRWTTIAVLAFCVLLLAGCPGSGSRITGKWAGTGSIHDAGIYEFRADHVFVAQRSGGTPETGTYSVDESKSPAWIDFIPANATKRTEGIIAFRGDDELEMAVAFPGDARPVSFSQQRHYLLRRLAK